ncbi:hypothetical protein F5Y04DRAFT_215247 [Hypomontagnella monticulosa]|nr:hypothetical protein F5Y04DRAFT_215247 [Hypomontagnella monticulosa]
MRSNNRSANYRRKGIIINPDLGSFDSTGDNMSSLDLDQPSSLTHQQSPLTTRGIEVDSDLTNLIEREQEQNEILYGSVNLAISDDDRSTQLTHGKSRPTLGPQYDNWREPAFSLDRTISHDISIKETEHLVEVEPQRAHRRDTRSPSYSRVEDYVSNSTHCSASRFETESHSRLCGNQARSRSCPTTTTSLFDDATDSCPYPARAETYFTRGCVPYSSNVTPSRPSPGVGDWQDTLSSLSSAGTDIPHPDDFWTWSSENENYFHLRNSPNGTEETEWYPESFA